MTLSWTSTGASYEVYRAAAGDPSFTPLAAVTNGSGRYTDSTAAANTSYTYAVVQTGGSSNGCGSEVTVTTGGSGGGNTIHSTIWTPSVIPVGTGSDAVAQLELGMRFTSSLTGYVAGIQFYHISADTSTIANVGHLWDATSQTLLGSATFPINSAVGWQEADFSQPVSIVAGHVYVVSYSDTSGHFAASFNYFAGGGQASAYPLQASTTGNGVFATSNSVTTNYPFPNQVNTAGGDGGDNYWVQPVFAAPTHSVIWGPSATPAGTASDTNTTQGVELGLQFTSDVSGYVTGIQFYHVSQDTGATVGHLWDNNGALMEPVTFATNSAVGWQEADFSQPKWITAGHVYTVSYSDAADRFGATGSYNFASGGQAAPLHSLTTGNGVFAETINTFPTKVNGVGDNYWVQPVFSTPVYSTIWTPSATPAGVGSDTNPTPAVLELGLQFTSSLSGSVTGVQFYHVSLDTGATVGHLWDATTQTLLNSATFASNSAVGWQEADFSQPVPIVAGHVYVVSYSDTVGYFAASGNYFASGGPASAYPLQGLTTGNGVFATSNNPNIYPFPNQVNTAVGDGGDNYWVQPVFSPNS